MAASENVDWFTSHSCCHVNNPGTVGLFCFVFVCLFLNLLGYATGKRCIRSYLKKKNAAMKCGISGL